MMLLGLPLLTLLGLFGAVAAFTTLLYILKLRRRSTLVVFAPLWRAAIGEKQTSALFSQLKRWLSLLLQLVLLALLVLALGDPRLASVMKKARTVVVLVDASASMKAHDGEPQRIQMAKRAVHQLIRGLSANDRMLIAQMDQSVTPQSALTADVAALHAATDRIEASDVGVDLQAALLFADDTLRQQNNPQVIVVSDGAFSNFEATSKRLSTDAPPLSFLPIGTQSNNVAITQFSVRRYPLDKARAQALIQVTNLMQKPVRVHLTLLGDGELLESSEISLAAGEELSRFFSNLAGVDQTLEAKIDTIDAQDWLAADDHAFALVPQRRRSRVAVVSAGNTYLEAALLLDEYLQTSWFKPSESPTAAEHFDVAVLDGVLPPSGLHADAELYLNPPADAVVQRGKALADFGFDSWDHRHPVLRFAALDTVQATEGFALKVTADDQVLGSSEQGPIFIVGKRAGQRVAALGFDPRDSDIVLRPAWPLLLLGSIDFFANEEQQYLSSYRTGEVWHLAVPAGFASITIQTPVGLVEHYKVKQGEVTFLGRQAGFYDLSATSGASRWSQKIAANLTSSDESRIAPAKELRAAQGSLPQPEGFTAGGQQQVWGYMLLVAFALSAIEWIAYHRRVSV